MVDNITFTSIPIGVLGALASIAWFLTARLKYGFPIVPLAHNVIKRSRFVSFIINFTSFALLLALVFYSLGPVEVIRTSKTERKKSNDFYIMIDSSQSMEEHVFNEFYIKKSKFSIAKDVVSKFIKTMPDDRFSLMLFATYPMTIFPMSDNKNEILSRIETLERNKLAGSTTRLDHALISGLKELELSRVKNKFLVLVTDGEYKPDIIFDDLVDMIKRINVSVYIAHIGKKENSYLTKISDVSNGKYFQFEEFHKISHLFEQLKKGSEIIKTETIVGYEPFFSTGLHIVALAFIFFESLLLFAHKEWL